MLALRQARVFPRLRCSTPNKEGQSQDSTKASKQPTVLERRKQLERQDYNYFQSKGQAQQMAGTEYIHSFNINIKRKCESYNCSPHTTGFCEATVSTTIIQCGWQVEPLFEEFAGTNIRQMGVKAIQDFESHFSIHQYRSSGQTLLHPQRSKVS